MKRFLLFTCWLLWAGWAAAKPLQYTIGAGQSCGPLELGQSVDSSLAALKGWTYTVDADYAIGPYYIFPKEARGTLVQFILGFDERKKLRDIEIHDSSCFLKGHSEVRLGCTRKQVEAALGARADNTDTCCDYTDLGIRFLFEDGLPPRAEDPHAVAKFSKGQCDSIQLYRPGSK